MKTPDRRQVTIKRICPGNYEVIDTATKIPLGRYGGRTGDKWASSMDGETITEGTSVSVGVLRDLIVMAAEKRGIISLHNSVY